MLPFYLSSGLVAPLWAIILLLLFWAALAVCAFRWFTRRPWVVLALPVAARAALGGAGRERVVARCDVDSETAKLVELIRSC